MTPLRVTAHLTGPVCLPNGPVALDSLLQAAVAQRDGLPPPASARECVDLPIPIAIERGIYLASVSLYDVELREADWTNRRFPIGEAQDLAGPRLRRIQITAGPAKSYRLPRERLHLVGDEMRWCAIGERNAVADLLTGWIPYVGKRRAVGLGRVVRWEVTACEPWGAGFPVLLEGRPLRSLPLDWPGLSPDAERAHATLSPPYWDMSRRVECAVPS